MKTNYTKNSPGENNIFTGAYDINPYNIFTGLCKINLYFYKSADMEICSKDWDGKIIMSWRKMTALILTAMLAVSLAACGGTGNNSQASGSTAEVNLDGDFTVSELRVAIWDNNQRDGLQQIADAWTETSGVKVNVEVIDWGNYWTLLEAGANGGDLPDVFWMHSNTSQMYMENDLLLNLDPYIAADDKIDLSNYYPGIVELFTRSDGVHYAVPKDHDTNALLYNKAIFDAYGVTYPEDTWTYEDMYEAAKQIYEASNGDVYGIAMNTSNNQDGW